MRLEPLDKDLFAIPHAFKMPGGIELGLRTTIVRLADGGLWLHSPGPLDESEFAAIAELGPVRAIVAPNRMHHLYVHAAHRAFPEAALFSAPNMEEHLGDLPDVEVLSEAAPALWKGQIEQLPVRGVDRLGEIVFFHTASRTLLLTDLAFNIQRGNLRTQLMMRANGAWQKFGPSRLARSFMKDKPAVRESIERLLRWDFDRVTVTHGDVVERGGHAKLRASYAWLLEAQRG